MAAEQAGTGRLAGRPVARVGYGAMQLEALDRRPGGTGTAIDVLRHAVELGVNHIDTADFYGDGTVNRLIRQALHPYRDELMLVTKVGARHVSDLGPGRTPLVAAQRPEELREQVHANLDRLGLDRLPVVNLRRLGRTGIQATGDQVVGLDDQLAELVALRQDGLIGGIGLSDVGVDDLEQALGAEIVCVQNLYHLLDRRDQDVLDLCARHDIGYVPFFPLGSAGFAGMARVTDDPTVITVATELDATPAQVGLAWLLARDPHILLIPGTGSRQHLEENVAAAELQLSLSIMNRLDTVSRSPQPAPRS